MTGGIPVGLVRGRLSSSREKRLLVHSGVSGLVESQDLEVVVRVLLDDSGGVVVGVERVHEDEGHVAVVCPSRFDEMR